MERLRDAVRQELRDAGWLVTSRDALKFGAHFLLYRPPEPHSVAAVVICAEPAELTFIEAQRFSRLCEAVGKSAIFAVHADGAFRYGRVDRWVPHIS